MACERARVFLRESTACVWRERRRRGRREGGRRVRRKKSGGGVGEDARLSSRAGFSRPSLSLSLPAAPTDPATHQGRSSVLYLPRSRVRRIGLGGKSGARGRARHLARGEREREGGTAVRTQRGLDPSLLRPHTYSPRSTHPRQPTRRDSLRLHPIRPPLHRPWRQLTRARRFRGEKREQSPSSLPHPKTNPPPFGKRAAVPALSAPASLVSTCARSSQA